MSAENLCANKNRATNRKTKKWFDNILTSVAASRGKWKNERCFEWKQFNKTHTSNRRDKSENIQCSTNTVRCVDMRLEIVIKQRNNIPNWIIFSTFSLSAQYYVTNSIGFNLISVWCCSIVWPYFRHHIFSSNSHRCRFCGIVQFVFMCVSLFYRMFFLCWLYCRECFLFTLLSLVILTNG